MIFFWGGGMGFHMIETRVKSRLIWRRLKLFLDTIFHAKVGVSYFFVAITIKAFCLEHPERDQNPLLALLY